jgi:hypothetical protein
VAAQKILEHFAQAGGVNDEAAVAVDIGMADKLAAARGDFRIWRVQGHAFEVTDLETGFFGAAVVDGGDGAGEPARPFDNGDGGEVVGFAKVDADVETVIEVTVRRDAAGEDGRRGG